MDFLSLCFSDEIAGCIEKAYEQIQFNEATRVLFFTSPKKMTEYAKKVCYYYLYLLSKKCVWFTILDKSSELDWYVIPFREQVNHNLCCIFAEGMDSEPRWLLLFQQSATADRRGEHPLHRAGTASHWICKAAGNDCVVQLQEPTSYLFLSNIYIYTHTHILWVLLLMTKKHAKLNSWLLTIIWSN